MAVIAAIGPMPMAASVSRTQQGGATGFTVPHPAGGPAAPPRLASPGMAASISGSFVLALQERAGRDQADEDGKRQGFRLLEELTRLQRALLADRDASSLEGLEMLVRLQPADVDPALAGVLASIRLRAKIEIERRSRCLGSRLTSG